MTMNHVNWQSPGIPRDLLIGAVLLLLGGCSTPPAPDSACTAFAPIYLSEGAIEALQSYRPEREEIASHNRTWEALCGDG